MLLYKPNAVLGIRSRSHFFYQCTVWTVNDILVDPYPFNAVKRVWIDQDVIDSPHCTWSYLSIVFGSSLQLLCCVYNVEITKFGQVKCT